MNYSSGHNDILLMLFISYTNVTKRCVYLRARHDVLQQITGGHHYINILCALPFYCKCQSLMKLVGHNVWSPQGRGPCIWHCLNLLHKERSSRNCTKQGVTAHAPCHCHPQGEDEQCTVCNLTSVLWHCCA